jgi:hypothetical protein
MQTQPIPGCQRETPVAQMYFASDLSLFQSSHLMDGKSMTSKINTG